jgi:hypothetical protein
VKSTATCLHCDKKFTVHYKAGDNLGAGRLNACLANHMKANHPEHYKPSKWVQQREKAKAPKINQAGLDQLERDLKERHIKPPLWDNIGLNPKPKRVYQRRAKALTHSADTHHARFCPSCGCNLNIINEAIKMGRGQ